MSNSDLNPRRVWLSLVIGLVSIPAAYLYVGHKRGFLATSIWLFLIPAFMILACRVPFPRIAMCGLLATAVLSPFFILTDVCLIARKSRPSSHNPFQRWWVYAIVMVLSTLAICGVSQLTSSFVSETFVVPGRAMAPTINHNDRIITDKLWFDASKLKRNDLAVFVNKNSGSQLNVMRIAGLPGETIQIINEELFVNGEKIVDQFGHFSDQQPPAKELTNYGPMKIPDRSYFVLGDNRRLARDSRIDGPIPFADFIAVAKIIYWSNDYRFSGRSSSAPKRGDIRWDRIGTRLDQ